MTQIVVAALYKFVTLADYQAMRQPLLQQMQAHGIKGTLLLAQEGINGTVSGTREGMDEFLAALRRDPRLGDLAHKESFCEEEPFYRSKVKLKKEIVTIGRPDVDPNRLVGTYIEPNDWNDLIAAPDVLVLDTRNDYEVAIGTFEGAVDPRTKSFGEFPDYVERNLHNARHMRVAMFCTGGIRCEKASSYMMAQGFREVYHLKGGILKYLEEVPPERSKWQGECFVFDQRVAVGQGLKPSALVLCHGCRAALTPQDRLSPLYEEGVSCAHCHDALSEKSKASARERQKQIMLAEQRGLPKPMGRPQQKQGV